MAAASGSRLLNTSLPLSRDPKIIAYQLSFLRNVCHRLYSNVGKTAAFMMRNKREGKLKKTARILNLSLNYELLLANLSLNHRNLRR